MNKNTEAVDYNINKHSITSNFYNKEHNPNSQTREMQQTNHALATV